MSPRMVESEAWKKEEPYVSCPDCDPKKGAICDLHFIDFVPRLEPEPPAATEPHGKDMCQDCWHPRSRHTGRNGNCIWGGYGERPEDAMRVLQCHCEVFVDKASPAVEQAPERPYPAHDAFCEIQGGLEQAEPVEGAVAVYENRHFPRLVYHAGIKELPGAVRVELSDGQTQDYLPEHDA